MINFNTFAKVAAAQAILQQVGFSTTGPAGTRTVQCTYGDGSNGFSDTRLVKVSQP